MWCRKALILNLAKLLKTTSKSLVKGKHTICGIQFRYDGTHTKRALVAPFLHPLLHARSRRSVNITCSE